MRVELGEIVRTPDGKEVGHVKHLILNPENGQVRAVVLEKGFLFLSDMEVPLDCLQSSDDKTITLTCTDEQSDTFRNFDMSNYILPEGDFTSAFEYPRGSFLWPNATPFPGTVAGLGVYPVLNPLQDAEAAQLENNGVPDASQNGTASAGQQRDNSVVIEEGSDVLAAGGERVGHVHEVSFDAVSGRPMRLVVSHGFIVKDNTELPGDAIATVENGVVHLNIDRHAFDAYNQKPTVPVV